MEPMDKPARENKGLSKGAITRLALLAGAGIAILGVAAYYYPRFVVLAVLPLGSVIAGIAVFDILRKDRRS
jgi:hypothetical protein